MLRISLLALLLTTQAYGLEAFNKKATYSAAARAIAVGTAPTDVCKISGSSTKTVSVTRVEISSTQSTAGINNWVLLRRSSDNTAGTLHLMPAITHDSGQQAASGSTVGYSANPTTGTLVGTLKSFFLLSPAPASVTSPSYGVWDYKQDGANKPIVLRGTAEMIAVNFNGATLPTGLSLDCNIEWSEE